jgi:hypothetical protein
MMAEVKTSLMPVETREAGRLERLGYRAERRKPAVLQKLSRKMTELISAMTVGVESEAIGKLTRKAFRTVRKSVDGEEIEVVEEYQRPLACHEPLSLEEGCDFLRIRRRQGRDLCRQALFVGELNKAVAAMKASERPRSLATLVEIRDDTSDPSAAARKVRLAAATTPLGEDGDGKRGGTNVNVNVDVGVQIRPGYMVRLPPQPESAYARPVTIEGSAVEEFRANASGGKPWSPFSANPAPAVADDEDVQP